MFFDILRLVPSTSINVKSDYACLHDPMDVFYPLRRLQLSWAVRNICFGVFVDDSALACTSMRYLASGHSRATRPSPQPLLVRRKYGLDTSVFCWRPLCMTLCGPCRTMPTLLQPRLRFPPGLLLLRGALWQVSAMIVLVVADTFAKTILGIRALATANIPTLRSGSWIALVVYGIAIVVIAVILMVLTANGLLYPNVLVPLANALVIILVTVDGRLRRIPPVRCDSLRLLLRRPPRGDPSMIAHELEATMARSWTVFSTSSTIRAVASRANISTWIWTDSLTSSTTTAANTTTDSVDAAGSNKATGSNDATKTARSKPRRHRDEGTQAGRSVVEPSGSHRDLRGHDGSRLRPPPEPPPGGPPGGGGDDGDDEEQDDWGSFDLGRALVELRSVRPGVVRRALRRLHLRWYHAGAATMKRLLSLAGVPASVTSQVGTVVDTCRICRSWARPAPKSVATSRISERFGEVVQSDLLFYKRKVILHVVDEATRYSVAVLLPNKSEEAIKEGFSMGWTRHYGPPQKVIADGEGGIMSLDSWFQSQKIELRPRAPGQHAQLAERHHEVLRQQLHRLEDQAAEEGVSSGFEEILTESIIAKNSLTSIAGYSPFQAVHGRTLELLDLSAERLPPNRLRELAISSMVEATARERARRAELSNTRPAAELEEYNIGDVVEVYRRGVSKDEACWHGPCQITDTSSMSSGVLSVKFQGRVLLCRLQDVRRALVYWSFLQLPRFNSPLTIMAMLTEQLRGKVLRLGWFQTNGTWKAFEGNRHHGELLEAALHVASFYLQLDGCLQLRVGFGIRSLEGIANSDDSVLLSWPREHVELCDILFMPGSNRVGLDRIYEDAWATRALVQFVLEDADTVQRARAEREDMDHLGPMFDRQWHRGRVRQVRALTDGSPGPHPGNVQQATSSTTTAGVQPGVRGDSAAHDSGVPVDDENEASQDSSSQAAQLTGRAVDDLQSRDPERSPATDMASSYEMSEYYMDPDALDDSPSLVFLGALAMLFGLCGREVSDDHDVTLYFLANGAVHQVIERTNNTLTREEALQHPAECKQAMKDELLRWQYHKAWRRVPRRNATNLLPSRWVLKWKIVDGKRIIKARLTVQGFRDKETTENYSGTATRWTQRLLLAIAVENNWPVAAADVSEAFLRGLTFAEVSKITGQPLRSVQLQLPDGVQEVLRDIPGLSDLDFAVEVLEMVKPGYGLKDAPRLWAQRLRRCLRELNLLPLKVDAQAYVMHEDNRLICMLTVHVDDIKLTGSLETIERVLARLRENFDKVKVEMNEFEHLGLKHRRVSDGFTISQRHYIEQLRPIPDSLYVHGGLDEQVTTLAMELFRSLVGGLAWAVQTRPDVAIFISALQRHLSCPLHRHCRDANRVLQYMQKKPLDVLIPRIGSKWRLLVISDSAFQGVDNDHLAVRSGVIALASTDATLNGEIKLQVLDTISKKQSRVCRSTLQAELHSALDLYGQAAVMAHGITEVLDGSQTASVLAQRFDDGKLAIDMELIIDARSVVEAVTPEHIRISDKITAIHLLKLAEHLETKQLKCLTWIDTRDMLADGLNKGAVEREPLRILCATGIWNIKHETHTISRQPSAAFLATLFYSLSARQFQ